MTEEGDLLIETAAGEIRQRRPFVYQERNGERKEVGGSFVVTGNRVTFAVGPYDPTRVLVIDPQIGYSTYIGGNRDDQGFFAGLAVDAEGNAYVSGETDSATGLLNGRTTRDAFVAKIDPTGEATALPRVLRGVRRRPGLRRVRGRGRKRLCHGDLPREADLDRGPRLFAVLRAGIGLRDRGGPGWQRVRGLGRLGREV